MQGCQMQNGAHVLSGSAHTKLIVRSVFESTTGANQAVHGNQELIAQERIIKYAGLAEGAEVVQRDFNSTGCHCGESHLRRWRRRRCLRVDATWQLCKPAPGTHLPRRLPTSVTKAEGVSGPACRQGSDARARIQAQWQSGHNAAGAAAVGRNSRLAPLFHAHAPRKCSAQPHARQ